MLRFQSQKTEMLKANPREFLKIFQVNADIDPFIYGCYIRAHAKVINMSRALLNARTIYPFSYNDEVKVGEVSMTAFHNWLNSIMDEGALEPTYPFGVNTRGMFLC